jgi:hypothetical protein
MTLVSALAAADSVDLKAGDQLKGLIVEEHEDRVILSTAEGELQVLRKNIAKIDYDDPSYSLMSLGRQLEREKKFGEALSYFEKAAQLNPGLAEAKQAAIGVRSKMWAGFTQGPTGEIEKQQIIQDSWRADTSMADEARRGEEEKEETLWKRLGVQVDQSGDFVRALEVRVGGYAHQTGLRNGDMLYSVDGRSLRYIQKSTVINDLLEPRYASMVLEVRRKIIFPAKIGKTDTRNLGIDLKLDYNGVLINRVKSSGIADQYRIKSGDRLVSVAGENTRYMPIKTINKKLKKQQGKVFTIETARTLQMARQ